MSEADTPVSGDKASEGGSYGVSDLSGDSADRAIHGRTSGDESGDNAPYEHERESRGSG